MNILLISQCDKRALVESRRILDQFAERRGERTWQTAITQAGLDTLRRLLRKRARKNTAVACHWIRGHDHSELLWIVGDRRRFNAEGAVPTDSSRRNLLRREDENDWHSLPLIGALAALAALLHDLGKACAAFQLRLHGKLQGANLYRHEWVSLRLFQAFVGQRDDAAWLQRLMEQQHADPAQLLAPWLDELLRDGIDPAAADNRPLAALPPLARAVAWLMLSHHRLPALPIARDDGSLAHHGARSGKINSYDLNSPLAAISADWNQPRAPASAAEAAPYWQFEHGLPVSHPLWRKRAARYASRLLTMVQAEPNCDWLQDPYRLHLARLSLMLADHHYSSLDLDAAGEPVAARKPYLQADCPLLANTCKHRGSQQMNQTLDEHLLGVEAHAGSCAHALPALAHNLARLQGHKGLKKRSSDEAFRWQDRAADLAAGLRQHSAEHGAFIVNMASTGCGKTLGNARIMNALAEPARGLRCAFAIGLRSLTLQTGRSFQRDLELDAEALAILVGGGASRELFEFQQSQHAAAGSESRESPLPPDSYVVFEGNEQDPILQRLGPHPGLRRLLAAPLLVCTVDHLMPATESLRGGHQFAPMLRLLSGDLVLDEPDDFDIDDLPALTRLVHWAGLLGSRLLLSSATLPPALVQGLFLAYRDGRRWFQRNRGQNPQQEPEICCLWVDEFNQQPANCSDGEDFLRRHRDFAAHRHQRLGQQAIRRRAALLPLPLASMDKASRRQQLAAVLRDAALGLHAQHHSADPDSSKRVSFGLIRMAHIDPLVDMALALFALGAPDGMQIHLCVYHAQFPLFLRSAIEQRLDQVLDRRNALAVFDLPDIRRRLDGSAASDHLFVVLGSPVTEVGRDHDYDWAIVEPSSMRSIIQLAGRVRRHRNGAVQQPNLLLWQRNLRALEQPGKAAYCRPGFEQDSGVFHLSSHDLAQLLGEQLDAEGQAVIDARPRIHLDPGHSLQSSRSLVDLEHARLQAQMLPASTPNAATAVRRGRGGSTPRPTLNASSHWQCPQAWLVGLLQQCQPFRLQRGQELQLALLPNEDGDDYGLHRCEQGERRWETHYVAIEQSQNQRISDSALRGRHISAWGAVDLLQAMSEQAAEMDLELERFAKKFAVTRVRSSTQGWRFHPLLGFSNME